MSDTPPLALFDRVLVRRHIARAAPNFAAHSVLFSNAAEELAERINEVKREFLSALDLSPFPFLCDILPNSFITSTSGFEGDAEELPTSLQSFDLVASNLAMHWINDVPGMMKQIHAHLKAGGMFIGSLIGEESLHELRFCLMDAEINIMSGLSPRLSPAIDMKSASGLLQRAGFSLPVVDKERVTLLYKDMYALMYDLRGMGQTNALTSRLRFPTRRTVFTEAARLYKERYQNAEGLIPATFDIIYLHGWRE